MTSGWAAVIGISVLLMAAVQIVLLIALAVAWQRTLSSMRELDKRMQSAVDEFRPQLIALVEEARSATLNVQGLAGDLRDKLDSMDEAARSMRARVNRVTDTVQWAATNLPVPMKVSGPAAMAAWAAVRVSRNIIQRVRTGRLVRQREEALRDTAGHLGIG